MPTRAEIEIALRKCGDEHRHKYLKQIHEISRRDVILYASAFTSLKSGFLPSWTLAIGNQDIQCFMAALHGLSGKQLDLVIHSPGGSLEAAAQIVQYLRFKYDHIRAIVPQNAMSAATMIACACDEIVMGKQSAIGPTDPQINFAPPRGQRRAVPAHAVISEYEGALHSINDNPKLATFWAARFADYPPGLFQQCQDVIDGSRIKLKDWLVRGATGHHPTEKAKYDAAEVVSASLCAPHKNGATHSQPISYKEARDLGMNVTLLEDDHRMQDAVLSLFHAVSLKFDSTESVKIVENHHGKGMHLNVKQPAE